MSGCGVISVLYSPRIFDRVREVVGLRELGRKVLESHIGLLLLFVCLIECWLSGRLFMLQGGSAKAVWKFWLYLVLGEKRRGGKEKRTSRLNSWKAGSWGGGQLRCHFCGGKLISCLYKGQGETDR